MAGARVERTPVVMVPAVVPAVVPGAFFVESAHQPGSYYRVDAARPSCTCPDWLYRRRGRVGPGCRRDAEDADAVGHGGENDLGNPRGQNALCKHLRAVATAYPGALRAPVAIAAREP